MRFLSLKSIKISVFIIIVVLIPTLFAFVNGKTEENKNVYIHDIDDGFDDIQPQYHQKINHEKIKSALITKAGGEIAELTEKEIDVIISAFNEYSNRAISEFTHVISDVQTMIEFNSTTRDQVVIYYANGLVHVKRTDIEGDKLVSYTILDDRSELEAYFRDKLNTNI